MSLFVIIKYNIMKGEINLCMDTDMDVDARVVVDTMMGSDLGGLYL